jgi:hypothetical protein
MRGVAALSLSGLALLAACGGEPGQPSRAVAAAVAPPSRADWSTGLQQLLPGIRACLAGSGGSPIGVTKAWRIGQSLTGVRLLEQDGSRLDCVAEADGGRVLLTEKVRPASRLVGERNPLYTPTAQRPSGDSCVERTVARDDAGAEVGWLSYEACREPGFIGPSAGIKPSRPARLPRQG